MIFVQLTEIELLRGRASRLRMEAVYYYTARTTYYLNRSAERCLRRAAALEGDLFKRNQD